MVKQILEQYRKYKPSIASKNICYHFFNRQQKKSFGNAHADKIFYVIRPVNYSSPFYIGVALHLLANYFYVISHLEYALQNNWIPVIDQQNYSVYTSKCSEIMGISNAWELFWNQPTIYTLGEVYQSRNVILSKRSWFGQWDMGYDVENYTNEELISSYSQLANMLMLKPEISEHIQSVNNNLFHSNERILGVAMRYVGYSKRSYFHGDGHPMAPELEVLINIVKERYEELNMDRVFLASDDDETVKSFLLVFGKKLVVLPRMRTDSTKRYDDNNINPLYYTEHIFDTTLNYLTEMELLSRCTGLIGSVTSGLRYALVRNNNCYEYVEILDCGRFADSKKKKSCSKKNTGAK